MPNINSQSVAGICAAFAAQRHDHVEKFLRESHLTLAGSLELTAWTLDPSNDDTRGVFILNRLDLVAKTRSVLTAAKPTSTLLDPCCEISLVSDLNQEDQRWWDFLERFYAKLAAIGYEKKYARALTYSLHEMADNIRQHASIGMTSKAAGLAGWHVAQSTAAFAVVDLGCGIKKSLGSCKRWSGLQSDRDALRAVILDHATRKAINGTGDGYKTVVQNFVSRNGCLALRSGSAELVATGNIAEGSIVSRPCPAFCGTRIAAWCDPGLAYPPCEPFLNNT